MPTAELTVTLGEVLEYRGSPLLEEEIWSVLHQALTHLQKRLDDGHTGVMHFVVTPRSIAITSTGAVVLATDKTNRKNQFDPAVKDKVTILSLGKALVQAAEYGLPKGMPVNISPDLEYVLCAMCDETGQQIPETSQLIEACLQCHKQNVGLKPYSKYTKNMYNAILGSGSEGELSPDPAAIEEYSRQTNSLSKENRQGRSKGRYKYKRQSRSYSRSKSRSRSRSRSPERRYEEEESHRTSRPISDRQSLFHPSSMQTEVSPTTARSYHLSDITFSSHQNGNTGASHTNKQLKPKSKSFATGEHMGYSAYEKYLRIKERQKKLKILRRGLIGEESDDEQPIRRPHRIDHPAADTGSMVSTLSYQQGAYSPAVHVHYGSEMALRMGRAESDRESIISSEMSGFNDQNAMRSMEHHYHHEKFLLPPPPARQPPPRPHLSNGGTIPKRTREYYGPEFVHKSSNPIIRIPIPLQGESLKNPAHVRRVVVVLLTGQKLEAMCDPSTTGQQLFEAVITHAELPEFFFFGLSYINDGEHFFIDSDTKLHKVAPEGWKDGLKGNLPPLTFTVYLRIKFYPEHIGMLRHSISRHLLYLQLRHDFLEERLMCSDEKTVALVGLAIQSEYGDYDQETMGKNYFIPEHYYCGSVIKRLGLGYIRDNTAETHCNYTGLSHVQAEVEFIKMAQQLQEYGIHFHKLLKNKNDHSSLTWVGITVKSLVLAENHGILRNITHQLPWHTIQKISFNKRRFSVQPKPDLGQGKQPKINYYTNSFRKGRYLLQFATLQHRFQLKMKARETNPELHDVMDATDIRQVQEGDESLSPEFLQESFTSDDDTPHHKSDPLPYRLPPGYRTDTSISMLDLRPQPEMGHRLHAMSMGDIHTALERNGEIEAYVIEPSSHSLAVIDSCVDQTINSTLQQRFNELPSPEKPISGYNFEVILEKDPQFGIGITIVGGENSTSADLGIFVKTVTPGGPADQDGRIKPGDRLISINDKPINGMQEAVQLIRESKSYVKLCVSQIRAPRSMRRKLSDDVIPNKLKSSMADPTDFLIYRDHLNSLPDQSFDDDDDDVNNVTHSNPDVNTDVYAADVSTMSQIESIKSEIVENEIPQSYAPCNTVNEGVFSDSEINNSPTRETSPETNNNQELMGDDVKHKENDKREPQVDLLETYEDITKEPKEDLPETFEVYLTKKDGSFGLNIAGGTNTTVRHGGIYVKSLIPQGAADSEGTIHKGDRILEINGKSLVGVTHKQAVEIIRDATESCLMVLERGRPSSTRSSVKSSRSSPGSVGHSSANETSESATPPEQKDHQTLNIHKQLYTKGIVEGVTPEKNGHVTEKNDHVTEKKCHVTADSSTESDANKDESSNDENAGIDIIGTAEENKPYPFVDKDNTFEVDLIKGGSGLGFSVQNEHDVPDDDPSKGLPRIKKIFPLGAAMDSGKLEVGDVILEMNGEPIKNKTHANSGEQKAITVIPTANPTGILKSPAGTQYETESEDEPVLYRDSLYTPPSGFTSDTSFREFPARGSISDREDPGQGSISDISLLEDPALGVTNDTSLWEDQTGNMSRPQGYTSDSSSREDQARDRTRLSGYTSDTSPREDQAGDRTRPSGYTSDSSSKEDQSQNKTSPPDLPTSPIPTLLQSQQFESEDDDLNSTLSSVYPEIENCHINKYSTYQNLVVSPFGRGTSPSFTSSSVIDNDETSEGSELDELDTRFQAMSTNPPSTKSPLHNDNDQMVRNPPNYRVGTSPTGSSAGRPGSGHSDRSCSSSGSVIVSPRKDLARSMTQSEGDEGDISNNGDPEEYISPRIGEIDVTLQRNKDEGLGFTLTGGASRGGCYINKLLPGPALSDGRLQPGDKLIRVNGVDMTLLNHFEAVTHLRNAPSIVTIRVYRNPNNQRKLESTEVIESIDKPNQGELEHVQSDEEIDPYTESVEGSTGHDEDESYASSDQSPQTTSELSPSVTSDSKQFEINDSNVQKLRTNSEIHKVENDIFDEDYNVKYHNNVNTPPGKMYGLTSQESEEIDSFGMNLSGTGLIKIDLEKPPSGELGFGLVTAEKDEQTGIFIKSIARGSIADEDGRLQVMDRIVQINGESLVGLTHKKAVTMLNNIQGKVVLTISRPSARQLDLITPPVVLDVNEIGEDNILQGAQDLEEDKESYHDDSDVSITDSEEEEMKELVQAAEKLLADTSEPDTEDIVPQKHEFTSDLTDFSPGATLTSLTSLNDNEELHTRTFNMSSLPRKLSMKVPEEVNFEWLCSCVPLMTLKNDVQNLMSVSVEMFQYRLDNGDAGEEYKELKHVKPTDNCNAAQRSENKANNRFRNVLPYDFNRVCLTGEKTYINASHITATVGEEESHYIACQGPLPHTSEQFWQMIWEQEVTVIMMLTLDVEARKVKCHRYWPDCTETPLFVCDGQLKVSLAETKSLEHFDIREIEIEKVLTGELKKVYHLNYTTWPDHGVPVSPVPLLQYLQLGHVYQTSGPLVVHCSAGIGRTGALITIDIALGRLEVEGKCDIFDIVKDLRRQRQGMIQTKDQYLLCYEACIAAMKSAVN